VHELVGAGQKLAKQSRFSEAQLLIERARSVRPNDFQIHLTLGSVLRAASRPTEAIHILHQAVKLQPEANWRAHLQIAYSLLDSGGGQEEAELSLRKAIKQAPSLDQAHLELSHLYQQQHRLDEAKHELEAVLQLAPDRGDVLFSLATLLLQQGQSVSSDRMLSLLQRVVQLSPTLRDGKSAIHNTLRAAVRELALKGVLGTSEHDWLMDYGYNTRKKHKKKSKAKRRRRRAEAPLRSPCRGRGFSAFSAALPASLFQRLVKEVHNVEPKLTPFDSAVGWWVPTPAISANTGEGDASSNPAGARCAIEEAVLILHRLAAQSCQQHPFLGYGPGGETNQGDNRSGTNEWRSATMPLPMPPPLSAIAGGEWWIQRRGGPNSRNASTNFHW
jgi:Flp pilus assembly protein TadD